LAPDMLSRIPVGHDDFRRLREAGLEYVDKSDMIRGLLDRSGGEVVLLPRPRRFGKTLNLWMLRCWFEKTGEDLSHLFSDLSIWRAGEVYRAHFQRYPVIHFNFKGSRGDTFEHCLSVIRQKIIDLYKEHRQVLEDGPIDPVDARRYLSILDGTAEAALHERALLDLSALLHARHGERVVILVDEYDEPRVHIRHGRQSTQVYRPFKPMQGICALAMMPVSLSGAGSGRDGHREAPGAAPATREFTTETRRAQRLHGGVNLG
jgi:hypothetical protein